MHTISSQNLSHNHTFEQCSKVNERKTVVVIVLTLVTMVVEISTGILSGSMALLADGWHMGTHAIALGVTWFAYIMARRYGKSKTFSFGTGKFGILAGYTSALFLGATAVYMIVESCQRFLYPVQIGFNEAIFVAIIGLLVNVLSVWILQGEDQHHDHGHSHQHDHNLKAAYLHVLADALTSVLAIIALLAGKYFGLAFLDPVMGLVGGVLVGSWAWGLIRSSGLILLDGNKDDTTKQDIIRAVENDGDATVVDLHLWKISSESFAVLVTLVASNPLAAGDYRNRLSKIRHLDHVTIEAHSCKDEDCVCRC